ncbi:hypothetical protein HU200_054369 [Digitaria exilis]|uniref:NAC domain-containing protein n=1 Tax=Digitaria exilis TaxID=1010633 RepID=A0A835E7J3_9POAL|nr:hypothetical protein HU200_054369 [Digitaria exilis]
MAQAESYHVSVFLVEIDAVLHRLELGILDNTYLSGDQKPSWPVATGRPLPTRTTTTTMEQQHEQWPAGDDVLPGYRFKPKARELIHHYLNPWVTRSPTSQAPPFGEAERIVCAADVYSTDPGTLTSRLSHFGHDDGNWYFLCVARWKDGNVGTRMSRAVSGGGTWHGSGKRIAVPRHGYRQTFEYRHSGGGKSAWLMEEFGTNLPEATGDDGVKVICRVHRTPKAAAAADDADAEKLLAPIRGRGHGFAAGDYWTKATADVGCSYASISGDAPPEIAGGSGTGWQQPMMGMEQGLGYQCLGVNGGGLEFKEETEPLETILDPDKAWQELPSDGAPPQEDDDDPRGKQTAT